MNTDELGKYLERVAADLGEHFEAVQILVSFNAEGRTNCLKRGVGNWYARQGMAHEFIEQATAQEHAAQLSDALNPPDDYEGAL